VNFGTEVSDFLSSHSREVEKNVSAALGLKKISFDCNYEGSTLACLAKVVHYQLEKWVP